MANPHRGEVEITLAGKTYVMRATFGAVVEIETKTGTGLVDLAERTYSGKPRLTDLTAVVWAGLRAAGEPATYEKVGEMVMDEGIQAAIGPVLEFLGQACTGGKTTGEAQAAEHA